MPKWSVAMKSKVWRVLSLSVILIVCAVSLLAHHGTGISYDQDKAVEVKGTVTEFLWKNPHASLYLDVKDDKGVVSNFAVELNSPGVLTRQGWNKNQFKVGDAVVIKVHPSRVNGPVGECLNPCEVTINGKEPPK
jgi:hypothetical protein